MKKLTPLQIRGRSRVDRARAAGGPSRVVPMLVIRKLLVPVDFTFESVKPLEYAAAVATTHQARVILLHVAAPLSLCVDCGYGPVRREVPDEKVVRRSQARLRRFAARHLNLSLVEDIAIRSGAVVEEINRAAAECEADLIILYAHADRKLDELHSRETVEKVARLAPCPVLIVRSREHDFLVEPDGAHPARRRNG